MLKEGQRLWYIHKETKAVKWIAVERVMPEGFVVHFDEKAFLLPYDALGTRLYLNPKELPVPKVTVKRSKPPMISTRPVYKPVYIGKKRGKEEVYSVRETVPVPEPMPERSCEICALRKNGTCGSLSGQLCGDYRPVQFISKVEWDAFPKYGDATTFRRRPKKK